MTSIEIPQTVSLKKNIAEIREAVNNDLHAQIREANELGEQPKWNADNSNAAEIHAFWDKRDLLPDGVHHASEARAKKIEKAGMVKTAEIVRAFVPAKDAIRNIKVEAKPAKKTEAEIVREPGNPNEVHTRLLPLVESITEDLTAQFARRAEWYTARRNETGEFNCRKIAEALVPDYRNTRHGQNQFSNLLASIYEAKRLFDLTDEARKAEARNLANLEVMRFSIKIAEKVASFGRIVSGEVRGVTTSDFSMILGFDQGEVLTLSTTVKSCMNSHGTFYYQWPTLVYNREGDRVLGL